MSRQTRIRYTDFICPAGHSFRAAESISYRAESHLELLYRTDAGPQWLPIPKCPTAGCPLVGEERSTVLRSGFAQVPESERFECWVGPAGEVSVPGAKGKPMPERYRRAGYTLVEAHSVRDIDKLDRMRARQTGNDAYHEMNYGPAARREREQADYNDDMRSEV
jgi:hypothetical protein